MKRAHVSFLLLGLAACGPSEPETEDGRPNVVFIIVDTLRQDHLGCYGYGHETSPSIDALAADGVRFERAYSQASWTTPSIASMMASRYPSGIGITTTRAAMSRELTLMPEVFQDAGYATAAVISHSFCGPDWNFDQGFSGFDDSFVLGHNAVTSKGITDRAISFLEEKKDEPFFLWLHCFDPHATYMLHEEFDPAGSTGYDGWVQSGTPFGVLDKRRHELGEADLGELKRIYDSEIAQSDHELGRLMANLKRLGVYDETMVVLTADHGEEFMEHDKLGHSKTLYEPLVHVPLIMKLPSWSPSVVSERVPLLDIFPTVAAEAGLEAPAGIDGRAIVPGEVTERPIFTETGRNKGQRAVVSGDMKLIEYVGHGRRELYDLSQDPGEQSDLSATNSEDVERLAALLEEWESVVSSHRVAAESVHVTEQEQSRLDALGYTGDDED